MGRIRRNWKLGAVAASCMVVGAGASAIAGAGAATTSSTAAGATATPAHHAARLRARRLLGRSVHGDLVVATKNGFVTITLDRGRVQSVNGQQLTLSEGTKTATYKTVILTIPTNAKVRDNGELVALGDVKAGQRATVVQGPHHTWVIARDVKTG
jgi:hypothetical protein